MDRVHSWKNVQISSLFVGNAEHYLKSVMDVTYVVNKKLECAVKMEMT